VRKSALSLCELTLSQRVKDARFVAKVVGKATLVALGAVVLVVELAADIFGGFWLDDLPFDGVREMAVEAVFAVAHIEVNARVVASINMVLAALLSDLSTLALAFADSKVLVGAEILDTLKFSF
jgi:predicted ATPase